MVCVECVCLWCGLCDVWYVHLCSVCGVWWGVVCGGCVYLWGVYLPYGYVVCVICDVVYVWCL